MRRFFVAGYDELRTRLTHRLGSAELAHDVLHETWLSLDRVVPAGPVQSPRGYLLRMAVNVALKHWGAENVSLPWSTPRPRLDWVDDAPGPERSAVARSEVEILVRALADLTPRRREILLASRLENIPLHVIAARLDVSQRLVEIELKHALAHCALRLGREVVQRFGPRPSKRSLSETPES